MLCDKRNQSKVKISCKTIFTDLVRSAKNLVKTVHAETSQGEEFHAQLGQETGIHRCGQDQTVVTVHVLRTNVSHIKNPRIQVVKQ